MLEKIAGCLFDIQCRRGILEEDKRKLYVYAYNLLLSRISVYVVLVAAGILLDNLKEMAVFLLAFIPLRQYAGGLHLKKAGSCIAASGILICVSGQYLKYYPDITGITIAIWIVAVCILLMLAPVDCANKRLDLTERKVYKRRLRILFCVECIFLVTVFLMGFKWISKEIMLAQTILTVSLILGWIKEIFFDIRLAKTNYK